jgi:hypothetical protein
MSLGFVLIWLCPFNFMHKKLRYSTLITLFNVVIAPFGNVDFTTYLLAEILTDLPIAIADTGRVFVYFSSDDWNENATKLNDHMFRKVLSIKWIFYVLTFLPYMWRMNQNLKKWLVYNH